MNSATKITVLSLAALILGACASQEEKRDAEQRIQAEQPVAPDESFANRGANLFVDAKGISEAQRQELLKIHTDTYQKSSTLRDEITKTKTALFRSILDPKVSEKEIGLMKNKIVKLDRERLDVMLSAFNDVQKVVGRKDVDPAVLEPFMRMDERR